MFSLIKKEINAFFGTVTGYLVVALFLTLNGLYLWVFPGYSNILDSGYANLESMFAFAPWLYLILIPAITMRSFSEELLSGTFELILTKPLSLFEIVMAKYIANLLLVLFSLIPTLVYLYTISELGYPKGNVDFGGIIGSYIGLFLLAAIYVAIGIFVSSLTKNQIVAFILAAVISLFMYIGFEMVSQLELFGSFDFIFQRIGIDSHYKSISKGVLDSRDLTYYFVTIFLFLYFTKLQLGRRAS